MVDLCGLNKIVGFTKQDEEEPYLSYYSRLYLKDKNGKDRIITVNHGTSIEEGEAKQLEHIDFIMILCEYRIEVINKNEE